MIEELYNLLPPVIESIFFPLLFLPLLMLSFVIVREILRFVSFVFGRVYPTTINQYGHRCKMSLTLISEANKGFIFNRNKIIFPKLLFFYANNWVVKVNNKGYKDIFVEDVFCKADEINKFITSLRRNNKDLPELWIQPYVDSERYGMICSHSKADFAQVGLIFNKIEETRLRNGLNTSFYWEKSLIKKLKKAEMVNQKPIVIHFALKNDKVIILEVKEQKIAVNKDPSQLSLARNINGKVSSINYHSYMGTSLLFMLLNDYVLYGQQTLTIRSIKSPQEELTLDEAFNMLMKIKRIARYKYSELSVTIKELSHVMKFIFSHKIIPSINHMTILTEINKSFYAPSSNIDICSKETLYFDSIIDSNSSQADCLNFLTYIAVNIVKDKMTFQDILTGNKDFNHDALSTISIDSFLKGIRPE